MARSYIALSMIVKGYFRKVSALQVAEANAVRRYERPWHCRNCSDGIPGSSPFQAIRRGDI